MSTAHMHQLLAVVDRHYIDSITKELLRHGVLHFISITELGKEIPEGIKKNKVEESRTTYNKLRKRIESFLDLIRVNPMTSEKLAVAEMEPIDTDDITATLDRLSEKVESVREDQRRIQQEILRLSDLKRQITTAGGGIPELVEHSSSLLEIKTGRVPPEEHGKLTEALKEAPSALIPVGEKEDHIYLLVTMKRYRDTVAKILDAHGWQELNLEEEQLTSPVQSGEDFDKQLNALKKEQQDLKGKAAELVEKQKEKLLSAWRNLRLHELYIAIEEHYGSTRHTVAFSGWVPQDKKNDIEKGIKKASEGKCFLEWHTPDDAVGVDPKKAPVKFTNPKILSPFQMLVENYSVPEYGTFDPTPVVAVSYLLMFALMFGDVGHGAMILLAGLIGSRLMEGKPIKRLFQLLVWCGASAMVAGVLFGSYFGMQWFPPLWFDYHGAVAGHAQGGFVNDIYGILTITIYFGIGVIGLGLIINWYNLIRKGRWFPLIFDKAGLLGGWMYGAGVYAAYYFINYDYKQLPPESYLFWMLGLPALLFFLKPVIEHIRKTRSGGHGFSPMTLILVFMDWIVEMLEVFSGYLANTLSFMRVAGLGIAHVSLMTAFFQIARMITPEGYSIGSIIILILGNLLVIVLEGLSAGIQSLRLNYYEFFSKYFSGSGIAYSPVSLKHT